MLAGDALGPLERRKRLHERQRLEHVDVLPQLVRRERNLVVKPLVTRDRHRRRTVRSIDAVGEVELERIAAEQPPLAVVVQHRVALVVPGGVMQREPGRDLVHIVGGPRYAERLGILQVFAVQEELGLEPPLQLVDRPVAVRVRRAELGDAAERFDLVERLGRVVRSPLECDVAVVPQQQPAGRSQAPLRRAIEAPQVVVVLPPMRRQLGLHVRFGAEAEPVRRQRVADIGAHDAERRRLPLEPDVPVPAVRAGVVRVRHRAESPLGGIAAGSIQGSIQRIEQQRVPGQVGRGRVSLIGPPADGIGEPAGLLGER